MVGIPKNTLDDYFWQVKLASEYGFDFKNNLDETIGVLRRFVKHKHSKKKTQLELELEFLEDMELGGSEEE